MTRECLTAFAIYMGALTTVTVSGFVTGNEWAAAVWLVPLFGGFSCEDEEE